MIAKNTKVKKSETISCPLDPEAATILQLHENLIQNIRFGMKHHLLDEQSLHLVYRHIAAAQEHLYQAVTFTASRAIGHAKKF